MSQPPHGAPIDAALAKTLHSTRRWARALAVFGWIAVVGSRALPQSIRCSDPEQPIAAQMFSLSTKI